ncbi:MAG: ribonuclease III domain-containing protein [Eubacteriales bacterium]|nr:ribonuclease III domain-containing protein [Eubacteriales bacterium]
MEKSLRRIADSFPVDEQKIKTYSPLSFAYIGDSVYDLLIRTMITAEGNSRPNRYHQMAIQYVNAKAQAAMMKKIEPHLTEEEKVIFRRGKNAKPATFAKNQTHRDYKIATGFETLIGYLYLKGEMERVMELVSVGFEEIPGNEER